MFHFDQHSLSGKPFFLSSRVLIAHVAFLRQFMDGL
jgi:hypothetical protein